MSQKKSRTELRQKKVKNKKSKKSIFKKIILTLFVIGLLIGVGITALFAYYISGAPDLDPEKLSDPFASEIYNMDGDFVTDVGGTERRIKIKYDDLPPVLVDAVVATEDSRFFEHPGIDIKRIFGAIRANFQHGFGSEGASTITQQVVENAFLTPDKTIELKVQEQWLALKLEREYSKEQIMEMYLNKIFYGSNAYGVAKAAEIYFGKTDLHELTLIEAAMLAGLPQRPTAYNPYENPDLMEGRVDTVLKLMVRHNKITQAEADEARDVEISSLLTGKRPKARVYDGFVQQVEREVREKLDGADINTDGLKIYTTLDENAQKHVEFLLTDNSNNPIPYPDDEIQSALAVIDNESGAIRAIGGARNNENLDGMNYAINLERQAGSTMKPIAAYGPAIEYENWSTYEQILDETFYPKGSSVEMRNFDRRHHGWLSMREALAKSYNVPAGKTLEEIGSKRVREFGTKIGINYAHEHLDARDAIGGTATNVTPLELASAYSAFANAGVYTPSHTITKVEFPDGTEVDLTPESEAVMKDSTAYMITDMLRTAVNEGTGRNAIIDGLDIAGKTGTTNIKGVSGANNAWFSGYSSKYTIAAWTGYNENNKIVSETQIPLYLFKETMTELSKNIETPKFEKPDSVVEVNVARGSNPAREARSGESSVKELFVKGYEPNAKQKPKEEKNEVEEKEEVFDSVTNLTANYNEVSESINVSWDHSDPNAKFIVSSNQGDSTTTESKTFDIENVKKDVTYSIQVIAENTDGIRSEARSVEVTVEEEKEEEIPGASGISASANQEGTLVEVNWGYDGPSASFEIIINNERKTTDKRSFSFNSSPGNTYTIIVTPVGLASGKKGPSASTTLKIDEKKKPEENNDNPEKPEQTEENNDNQTNDSDE